MRRRHQHSLLGELYALGNGWTGSVKQAIYQLITSERLDEHMPPLSQDRGIINEEDALWNGEGAFVIGSLMQLFSYVETECRQSIAVFSFLLFLSASPLRGAYLPAPNQLCYKWSCSVSETDYPVFFLSTGCQEVKIDKLHFSLILLCPGLYSCRRKEHHQVCVSRGGTQAYFQFYWKPLCRFDQFCCACSHNILFLSLQFFSRYG